MVHSIGFSLLGLHSATLPVTQCLLWAVYCEAEDQPGTWTGGPFSANAEVLGSQVGGGRAAALRGTASSGEGRATPGSGSLATLPVCHMGPAMPRQGVRSRVTLASYVWVRSNRLVLEAEYVQLAFYWHYSRIAW